MYRRLRVKGIIMASLIELDKTYHEVLKEYHNSPSGSKKEFELGKKLDKLDKEIAEKSVDVEFDWGND